MALLRSLSNLIGAFLALSDAFLALAYTLPRLLFRFLLLSANDFEIIRILPLRFDALNYSNDVDHNEDDGGNFNDRARYCHGVVLA